MDGTTMHMVAERDIPELEIRKGDLIRWARTASEHPFLQTRRRSFDYGALLVALNQGALSPVTVTPGGASPGAESPAAAAETSLRPLLRLHRRLG